VKKMLKQMMKLDNQGQVVTLAMMISGIVMSRNAQLSAMSSERLWCINRKVGAIRPLDLSD